MNITTSIETITPEIAKQFLMSNHAAQRNMSIRHCENMAAQMKKGLWKLNGEPIIIDGGGNILDGQHRLRAVTLAGIGIDFLVVRGVAKECFTTIDGGMKRTAGNIFQIAGISNSTNLAACVGLVMNYRRAVGVVIKDKGASVSCGGSLSSSVRLSPQELIDEYRLHESEYNEAIRLTANRLRNIMPSTPPACIAALGMIDGNMGSEWVGSFWESVATGENLSNESPAYHLRERHIANKANRHRFSFNHSVLLCAKAWNLYASEKTCKILRLSDERAFPIL